MNTSIKIQENIPLAEFTTFKIGGNARFFVRAETEDEVVEAFNFANEHEFELFVLGGGSNVLISDEGFDGLVLQIALRGIEFKENIVTAQAGEDWDEFVKICVENNLQGVEALSGIPGLIGGTPVQNVGAYGQEVSETITKVRVFDRKSQMILELSNEECKFAYRTSIFNTTDLNRFIVLAVTFELFKDAKPKIVYKDLLEYFAGKRPNLTRTREAVLEIRRAKSMVIEEQDENSRSAGSFFKNPFVENEKLAEISAKTGIINIPHFKIDDEKVKIPAAWLIENAGFSKGYKLGRAGISTKHTLVIVNSGDATAKEIIILKNEIQAQVERKFAISLVPEPVFIGFKS